MAVMRVWDGGSNTSPYETWVKAATTMATALAAQAAGEQIWVASDHSEILGGDVTYVSANGTRGNIVTITSVDRSDDSYQTMANGGGLFDNSGGGDVGFDGNDVWVGIAAHSGDDIKNDGGSANTKMIDCDFITEDDVIQGEGAGECNSEWINCRLTFNGSGKFGFNAGRFVWRGGSLAYGGSGGIDVALVNRHINDNRSMVMHYEDLNLSVITGGSDYLTTGGARSSDFVLFKRCQLSGTFGGVLNEAITQSGRVVHVHSCSFSDVIHDIEEYYAEGTINDDTATYLDATYDGTNEYSIKMVSSSYAKEWVKPLKFKLCEVSAAVNSTITVELNTDNITLQDDEFWIEIESPDATIGALGNVAVSRPATILTTPANLTGSAAAWTEGFGTEVPQKVALTIAGGQAGIYTIWSCLGKPSTTVYVSPKVAVT